MTGVLLIISGPSGVGKTTICHRLEDRLDAFLSISVTTRPKRDNEVDGQDYRFISHDAFEKLVQQDELLEYARIYGGYSYGTPAGPVHEALENGRVVILEIDIDGAEQVVRKHPDALTVFILAPTPEDQKGRLVGRKSDSAEAVAERLSKADGEIRRAHDSGLYRHFIVNVDLDETVDQIVKLVQENRQT